MAERERETELVAEVHDVSSTLGLQATWGLGNQLYVFPGKKPTLLPDGRPRFNKEEEIKEFKWNLNLYHPILRKVVNESHNTFVMLQRKATELSGAALHSHILKSSKNYRSIMKAYSISLRQSLDETRDENQREMHAQQLKLLDMAELIWSLCEILFIENPIGGLVIGHLLDWFKLHFSGDDELLRLIEREESPERHPAYWDFILRFVLHGQIDQARRLLSFHSDIRSESFQIMDSLLKKMPLYTHLYRGSSVAEFDMKWRHWRDECERAVSEQVFAVSHDLHIIARVLCGDESVFSEQRIVELCKTWYHMLVCKMLYINPTVKACDLHYNVQGCLDEYMGDVTDIGGLNNILISALEFNIHQVIKDSCVLFTDGWFVAHLTDLLQHCGQLEANKLQFGSNLREFLLLEYANCLMSHKSLWIVGVSYLDSCPEFGRKCLELYIENMPIETERKAEKLLHICQERDMIEQSKSICKIIGMRHIQNGRLGAALNWFLRSKDVAFATVLAERYLLEYNEHGQFSNLDLLDNLGPSMVLSNRLTFLGKYREFHKLYEKEELHEAGSLLLSLLQARLAPKQFWITLLVDAIPLLQAQELIFNSSQTYDLMHCLEELTKEYEMSQKKGSQQMCFTEAEEEKLNVLRCTLTTNLSRAILKEGTVRLV